MKKRRKLENYAERFGCLCATLTQKKKKKLIYFDLNYFYFLGIIIYIKEMCLQRVASEVGYRVLVRSCAPRVLLVPSSWTLSLTFNYAYSSLPLLILCLYNVQTNAKYLM